MHGQDDSVVRYGYWIEAEQDWLRTEDGKIQVYSGSPDSLFPVINVDFRMRADLKVIGEDDKPQYVVYTPKYIESYFEV
jgi:hypothetical protein